MWGQGGGKVGKWRGITETEPIFQQGPVTNKPGNLQSRQEDILSRRYQMSALVLSITLEKTDPVCVSGLPEQMLVTHSPRARDKQAGSKQGFEAAAGSCLGCLPYSLSSLSLGQKHELSQGHQRGSVFKPSPQNFSPSGYETQLLRQTQTIVKTPKQTVPTPCQAPF